MQRTLERLSVALVLVLGTTLPSASMASASQPRLFLREEPATADQSDEMPAPNEPAPPPTSGPGSDQPWYSWRNDVSEGKQALGMINYSKFWSVREEFLAEPSFEAELNLTRVMAGEPLQNEVAFIKMLEAKGQAQIVQVQHRPKVVYADDENYVVVDSYLDQSYIVDAQTREPVDSGPPAEPEAVNMAYHFHLQGDRVFPDIKGWRVVDWQAVTFVDQGTVLGDF